MTKLSFLGIYCSALLCLGAKPGVSTKALIKNAADFHVMCIILLYPGYNALVYQMSHTKVCTVAALKQLTSFALVCESVKYPSQSLILSGPALLSVWNNQTVSAHFLSLTLLTSSFSPFSSFIANALRKQPKHYCTFKKYVYIRIRGLTMFLVITAQR